MASLGQTSRRAPGSGQWDARKGVRALSAMTTGVLRAPRITSSHLSLGAQRHSLTPSKNTPDSHSLQVIPSMETGQAAWTPSSPQLSWDGREVPLTEPRTLLRSLTAKRCACC